MAKAYRGYSKSESTAFQRKLLNRRLDRISRLGDKRAGEICKFIADGANRLAPNNKDPEDDDNGTTLKGSYEARPDPEGDGWVVGTSVRYWVFVEFGTAEHGDAQPHVRPAIDAARGRWRF